MKQRHRPARTIAIDGPAASGKSVAGARVASALGYHFVDTGAMYRAMAWLALRRGVPIDDAEALARLAASTRLEVDEATNGERTVVRVDGEDATPHLRAHDVEASVSLVSRVPGVREAMVRIQRALAAGDGVVMAGRDIGTVVLPNADLKIYLDAPPAVRARRRADQLRTMGMPADVEALTKDLERRDAIDSSRETSPLTAAPDAVIINTDDMVIDDVVARVLELAA